MGRGVTFLRIKLKICETIEKDKRVKKRHEKKVEPENRVRQTTWISETNPLFFFC